MYFSFIPYLSETFLSWFMLLCSFVCFVLLLINVKYFGGDTPKILSLLNLFKCKFQTLKTKTIKKVQSSDYENYPSFN